VARSWPPLLFCDGYETSVVTSPVGLQSKRTNLPALTDGGLAPIAKDRWRGPDAVGGGALPFGSFENRASGALPASTQGAESGRLPRAQGHQNAQVVALPDGQTAVLAVQVRKVVGERTELLQQRLMGGRCQPASEEDLCLVAAVKGALEEFVLNVLINEALDGSPGKPAEVRRDSNSKFASAARRGGGRGVAGRARGPRA